MLNAPEKKPVPQFHLWSWNKQKREGSSTQGINKGQQTAKHGQLVSIDYFLLDSGDLDLLITFLKTFTVCSKAVLVLVFAVVLLLTCYAKISVQTLLLW